MNKRPHDLLYDVNEKPPWAALILLGFQHIFILSIAFIFPVVIVDAVGGSPADTENLICMSMIATGLATILQGMNRGPIGSGYLCPLVNGPAFLSASLLAGKAGGLPLIFGMTAVAGVFEAVFSRLISHMRAIFPPAVTGTIVLMVGIEIVPIGVTRFLGMDKFHGQPHLVSFLVALVTLLSMIGFNIWGKGKIRLYSVLFGFFIGYAAAFGAGVLDIKQLAHIWNAPIVRFPNIGTFGMSFSFALLVPFLVAALSSALKTMGDLSTCQKINDAEWKRPDMHSISRGILANAAGNLISGFTGALGQSVSSSNVGLSLATGATSRRVAWSIGGLLILMAFVPKLAAVFVIMPTPVMGASLIFAACFMMLAGVQIITARLIDARKTFVIGISVAFGLCVDFLPEVFRGFHPWLQPFIGSSLSLATLCAIAMNLFLRIGIAKTARLELVPGKDFSEKVFEFMETQGAAWGALKDVVHRAATALNEFLESAAGERLAEGPLSVLVSFDEFNLDLDISYQGREAVFPDRVPETADLIQNRKCLAALSGFLIRRSADKVKTWTDGSRSGVILHFNH